MSKVLIVEDETMLSEVYAMVLQHNGFTTEVANNGEEALQIIDSFDPDVVILDLLMPKMDGITFLKTYKSVRPGKPVIIVYSNLFDSHKVEEIKALGAIDIVLKSSMTPNDLTSLVQSHL